MALNIMEKEIVFMLLLWHEILYLLEKTDFELLQFIFIFQWEGFYIANELFAWGKKHFFFDFGKCAVIRTSDGCCSLTLVENANFSEVFAFV